MFLAHVPAGMGFPGVPGPPITAPPQSRSRVVESRGRFASTFGRLFTVVDGNRAVVGLRGMMVCGYGRPWISIHGCGGGRPWGSREDRNPAAVFRAAVNGYRAASTEKSIKPLFIKISFDLILKWIKMSGKCLSSTSANGQRLGPRRRAKSPSKQSCSGVR